MPYYCTVPRCTSLAGKAKNVSFHQFPRDEQLAERWNVILKRGKPYTKYSKVCSLHFRPEDYTMTSVGKNRGQWRTLRKDAIPSRNLPSDSPVPYQRRSRNSESFSLQSMQQSIADPQVHQQVASAIYFQTMLAIQASGLKNQSTAALMEDLSENINRGDDETEDKSNCSEKYISQFENFLSKLNITNLNQLSLPALLNHTTDKSQNVSIEEIKHKSQKCEECSKCFRDPDVFLLHKRWHESQNQKNGLQCNDNGNCSSIKTENIEELDINLDKPENVRQEIIKANPILANLLTTGNGAHSSDSPEQNIPLSPEKRSEDSLIFVNDVLSMENDIMTAMVSNMQEYMRNLAAIKSEVSEDGNDVEEPNGDNEFENCDNDDLHESKDSDRLIIDESA